MKTLLIIILTSNYLLLSAQNNPVSIDLTSNGNKLDARFYMADKLSAPPTVILLHGYPGNSKSPYGLAEMLVQNGINVLVFNYEGSFNSEGVYSFENCMDDISAAISFTRQNDHIQQFSIDTSKVFVCGCSLGAAFALSAAIYDKDIRKIIAVAGGNDLSLYLQKMNTDQAFRIVLEKRIASATAGKGGPINGDSTYIHHYFDRIMVNYAYFDLINNADKFKNKHIHFITGWSDTTVPPEEFILPTYRQLKKLYPDFISIQAIESDHNFTNTRDELARAITSWIKAE